MQKRILYSSQPFGFDAAMLARILSQARRNNALSQITGALICRQDIYLQLIEGPVTAIDGLFDQIRVDDRHTKVQLLLQEEASERLFPAWSMVDDDAPSLFWSREEVEAGALEAASPAELMAPFLRLKHRLAEA